MNCSNCGFLMERVRHSEKETICILDHRLVMGVTACSQWKAKETELKKK